MIPNKHLQSLYFPNHLPVSVKKKYSSFYVESNKKLTYFITQRIFESWRSQINQIKLIKKQRNNKLLKEIVVFWRQYSTQKMIQRAKSNEIAKRHNFYTLLDAFGSMKEYLHTKIDLNKRRKLFSTC